jgi:hypothetical protein
MSTRRIAPRRSRRRRIAHGFVNLAGDVRVWGGRPEGAPWRVGIRHPRIEGETIGGIEIADGAVATSGDYERCFEVGGRRYCHLLDATTGWPVQGWRSVSVAAPLCVVAGSGATVGMLLGDAAPAWLDAQGVDWLGVDAAATSGSPPIAKCRPEGRPTDARGGSVFRPTFPKGLHLAVRAETGPIIPPAFVQVCRGATKPCLCTGPLVMKTVKTGGFGRRHVLHRTECTP